MKKLGYRLFALIYYICCIFPRKKNQVFCIMTHDSSQESNVGVMIQSLMRKDRYKFCYLKKEQREFQSKGGRIASVLEFFFCKPYQMARSSYILQDNVFLPMAYMKFPKSVKVVQLWHGTGTIKRFGQSVNEGELGKLEKHADAAITHLIVNGPASNPIYQEAFGIQPDQVYELGLPRTDILFDRNMLERLKKDFFERYPKLKGKRLVLYAPTFRDAQVSDPKLGFDLESLMRQLPEDMCLLLKLHPYVAKNFHGLNLPDEFKDRVVDVSMEMSTNQMLEAADVLITDYSSIIFEYCILRKPMLFYAYDYEDFKSTQRGFYLDYESFVPGEVVYTQDQLVNALQNPNHDISKIDEFIKEQYRYTDGKSAKRIVNLIFN